jgi:hypothetical protein
VQPYLESDLFHDFSERATGDIQVLYQYAYNYFVLDLTQNPPRDIGPDKLAFLTSTVGYTYRFTQEAVNTIRVGGTIASAPPRDPDQRPVLAPAVLEQFGYTKPTWGLIATGGYTYGSVNPRLGAGPSINGGVTIVGTPVPRGSLRDFAVLVSGTAGHSSLVTGVGTATQLNLYVADAEFRYAINTWLGLLGGYSMRYATFVDAVQVFPPFLQNVVFIGVSGYFTTDKTLPVLTTFAAPVIPG